MKKFILGIIIGFVLFMLFLLSGGGEYLKRFGKKTEEAGERLEEVGEQAKESIERMKKTIKRTKEKVKDIVGDGERER